MGPPNLAVFKTVEFLGFYLPPLMIWALAALIPYAILHWVLGRWGLYRFVWHPALLNIALYVLLVGGVAFLGTRGWL